MKNIIAICLFIIVSPSLRCQDVGLVLSGGGAPGIAHIGVIKALEENHIPIDYITSTSIGAIVGGLYAMGYSPEEMIRLLKSDEFKRWSTGETATRNQYAYYNPEFSPEIIGFDIRTSPHWNILLPGSLIPPREINYAFSALCNQASVACENNFDQLMIPFRCVASDVFNKKPVVFSKSDLATAIRSSMAFPFLFKPIENENRLLFDGGINNNFPADVMTTDFAPDFCIGSVVAYNPPKAEKKDILMQLQNMIVSPTDYKLGKNEGLLLKFNLNEFGTFDFSKVDELVKTGYDSIMKHMPEIKARVKRRISDEELTGKRKAFRSKYNTVDFCGVNITGLTKNESIYVRRFFKPDSVPFTKNDFRKIYYQLTAGEIISEVNELTTTKSPSGKQMLHLNVETNEPWKLSVGGNIATFNANELFAGINYRKAANWTQTGYLQVQLGGFYNGIAIGTRLEFPSRLRAYLRADAITHQFNYFNPPALFTSYRSGVFYTQHESYAKLAVGTGIESKARLELGVSYGVEHFRYNSDTLINILQLLNNRSQLALGNAFVRLESSTLNRPNYATEGYLYMCQLKLTKTQNLPAWWQLKVLTDGYFKLLPPLTVGALLELTWSDIPPLQNRTLSLLYAGSFQPTNWSKTVFNPAFSSNQYMATGLKPVFRLTDRVQLRLETYWFMPFQQPWGSNEYLYIQPFRSVAWLAEPSIIFHYRTFSASLFADCFSKPNRNWQVGINIGTLVLRPKAND
jgi:Predicted esterase of the alpha-beta hydrolase superfamily